MPPGLQTALVTKERRQVTVSGDSPAGCSEAVRMRTHSGSSVPVMVSVDLSGSVPPPPDPDQDFYVYLCAA
ncbi:hypothetical protein EYF80_059890 [Liparis tanakae]|uniref:Uncharacterized protein n=1 Tax=Liparis tanakae TaxID=230148 RepID=A0A4Z2EN02_9TELE|nr:hypothetical protein EYF80_059890 [Liparis tanakae]